MKSLPSLLLVEDDLTLRNELAIYMENFFGVIDVTDNAKNAYEMYQKKPYDLVLTDIQLPKEDGLVLLKNIKKIAPQQLIIVMSAFSETEYFLKSIEFGIFSFLIKPFNSEQLMETMFKVTKEIDKHTSKENAKNVITLSANVTYNIQKKYLYINNVLEILTHKEEKLLYILVKNIEGHVSDSELKNFIWESESVADSTVRVLIKRLREKLGYEDAIINLKGRGYKLTTQPL